MPARAEQAAATSATLSSAKLPSTPPRGASAAVDLAHDFQAPRPKARGSGTASMVGAARFISNGKRRHPGSRRASGSARSAGRCRRRRSRSRGVVLADTGSVAMKKRTTNAALLITWNHGGAKRARLHAIQNHGRDRRRAPSMLPGSAGRRRAAAILIHSPPPSGRRPVRHSRSLGRRRRSSRTPGLQRRNGGDGLVEARAARAACRAAWPNPRPRST